MVSAWYAVVFILGMCFGAFYRVSEVVQLKKKVKDYEESISTAAKKAEEERFPPQVISLAGRAVEAELRQLDPGIGEFLDEARSHTK